MSDRHVVPADEGWHVEKNQAQRRARARAGKTAARGAASGADRLATIGVGDELETGAQRTGRDIYTITERAARPLDAVGDSVLAGIGWVNHAFNPVRVTGRVIGAATATLRIAGLATVRGTLTVQRATRALGDPDG